MNNIIMQNEIENHSVQRYRFKVLGSQFVNEVQEADEEEFEEETFKEEKSTSPKIAETNDNGFIEELLKRSDELSSNIVKLQMQIERQEEDFEKRLKEDVEREKEKSFSEGYDKAKADLEVEFNSNLERYKASNQKLNDMVAKIENSYNKLENDLVSSAVEIAKEVIKKEIATASSEIAAALSKNLLDEIKDANNITLKVNPNDFAALKDIYKNNDKIKLETDDAISKGGVILLSESGNLDGTISERLEKVKYLLKDS